MSLRSAPDQQVAPRRDVLGFSKSVVEFFTGMTGLAAALVTVFGTALTIAVTSGAFDPSSSSPPTAASPPSSAPSSPSSPSGPSSPTGPSSSPTPSGVDLGEIESTIQTDFGAQRAEFGEIVDSVSCEQDSDTHATCTAAMSGNGPSSYAIDVDIDADTGLFTWIAV